MARRPLTIQLAPLVGALADPAGGDADDPVTAAILDAAAAVLAASGLRHCTVEEIAEQGRLGRTTIYRRFDGRDDLIHAVLAREVRRVFAAAVAAVAHLDRYEERVVEALLAGLRASESSLLTSLARSEPELLHLLTAGAGPIIAAATAFLAEEHHRVTGQVPTDRHRHTAELLVRLALSLVVAPTGTLPLDDEDAARTALHDLLGPLLRS